MKKIIALLTAGLLLAASALAAEEEPVTVQAVTGLGKIREKLDQGVTIEKVYYTDGYGFSISEFTTDDPEEIELLWKAVNAITVGKKTDLSITDWYPEIVFYLSDGTFGGAHFEAHWLCVGRDGNYEIDAEEFWSLTSSLVAKYSSPEEGTVPDR